MNESYLRLEDAEKLANYNKLMAKCTMLESDNLLLKTKIKNYDKKYLKIINEKNKRIKELETALSELTVKQERLF